MAGATTSTMAARPAGARPHAARGAATMVGVSGWGVPVQRCNAGSACTYTIVRAVRVCVCARACAHRPPRVGAATLTGVARRLRRTHWPRRQWRGRTAKGDRTAPGGVVAEVSEVDVEVVVRRLVVEVDTQLAGRHTELVKYGLLRMGLRKHD